jgi:hypothetical protein
MSRASVASGALPDRDGPRSDRGAIAVGIAVAMFVRYPERAQVLRPGDG